ncbi:unnamed protein product [Heligmosomoides polygyrus]|uniref:Endo/exonuclease/phosphatase domain-containing protein n=1 Tax=Heligmosomoides polygyrus TaxID=6339 RepID=A0A183FPS5_HELPZ|nr:unnamed protein product [Heligmosomoides polygyrus]
MCFEVLEYADHPFGQLDFYPRDPLIKGKTRVATLNVGTLTDRLCELVEALERRRIDFCAVQETRWSCCKSRDIGRGFKAVLCGNPRTTSGVGMIVSERFRDAITSVERFDDRLMKIIIAVEEPRCHFFSAYAAQTGCSEQTMDEFWSLLDEKKAEVPSEDMVVVDLNGPSEQRKTATAVMVVLAMSHATPMVSVYRVAHKSCIKNIGV